ncbi:hypothetical protein GCM10025875_14800 [Litorihabitans aurantiacus]|uniref:Uncharacterized protein n=1 Tax=Litorihabitans aurantiacus TaxID=1930061 RepID=A0AA37XE25_9MICO|nr:hypothetical protein GCM10025875_14800 [Litorihabitans aurantiacus]
MLPHVEHEERDEAEGEVALLVVQLHDDGAGTDRVPGQHGPAGPLHAGGDGREVLLERLDAAEVVLEGREELAGGLAPSGERFSQKTVWLTWPPRLKARFLEWRFTAARSPDSRASASFSSAVLAPVT